MEAELELRTLTSLLDLEGFEVVDAAWDRQAKLRRLTVVPTTRAGLCPHCRRPTDHRHACHDRVVTDLPMGGQRVELVVRLFQFHCPLCRKFFTPAYVALAPGAHATERFLERLCELAGRGDVASAARFFGIPEKTAEDWYYACLLRKPKQPAADLQPVRSLGIDELSLKKGTASSAAC